MQEGVGQPASLATRYYDVSSFLFYDISLHRFNAMTRHVLRACETILTSVPLTSQDISLRSLAGLKAARDSTVETLDVAEPTGALIFISAKYAQDG